MINHNNLSIKRHIPEMLAIAIGGLVIFGCGEDDAQSEPTQGSIKTYERTEAKGYLVDKITDGDNTCYVAYIGKEEGRLDPVAISIDCIEEKK